MNYMSEAKSIFSFLYNLFFSSVLMQETNNLILWIMIILEFNYIRCQKIRATCKDKRLHFWYFRCQYPTALFYKVLIRIYRYSILGKGRRRVIICSDKNRLHVDQLSGSNIRIQKHWNSPTLTWHLFQIGIKS